MDGNSYPWAVSCLNLTIHSGIFSWLAILNMDVCFVCPILEKWFKNLIIVVEYIKLRSFSQYIGSSPLSILDVHSRSRRHTCKIDRVQSTPTGSFGILRITIIFKIRLDTCN